MIYSNWSFWVSVTVSLKLIKSCARQRLVAASSRSTLEKVASRRGSGRHCLRACRARLLSLSLHNYQYRFEPRHEGLTSRSSARHA